MGCETNDCCCGCTVKIGTLILLWLDVVFWGWLLFLFITNSGSYSSPESGATGAIIICAALGIVAVLGIFAVHQNKVTFLVPYFIYRILLLIIVILVGVSLLVMGGAGYEFTQESTKMDFAGQRFTYSNDFIEVIKKFFLILIVIGILLIVMQVHFLRVVYSCLKSMESASGTSWKGTVLSQARMPIINEDEISRTHLGLSSVPRMPNINQQEINMNHSGFSSMSRMPNINQQEINMEHPGFSSVPRMPIINQTGINGDHFRFS